MCSQACIYLITGALAAEAYVGQWDLWFPDSWEADWASALLTCHPQDTLQMCYPLADQEDIVSMPLLL